MENNRRTNRIVILIALCAILMFGWTLGIISSAHNANIPTAISAFNA